MTRSQTTEKSSARLVVIILAGILLGGCATSRPASDVDVVSPRERVVGGWSAAATTEPSRVEPAFPTEASLVDERRDALLAVVDTWLGTPYQYGGSTRRGVDCSAFVQSVYRDGLGIGIPRSTEHQRDAGSVIDPADIGFGDLVFFRITPSQRHVGVVIGPGKFAHSASSSGVTVSRLDEPYWRTRFDRAVRFDQRLAAAAASPVVPVPRASGGHLADRPQPTGVRTGW